MSSLVGQQPRNILCMWPSCRLQDGSPTPTQHCTEWRTDPQTRQSISCIAVCLSVFDLLIVSPSNLMQFSRVVPPPPTLLPFLSDPFSSLAGQLAVCARPVWAKSPARARIQIRHISSLISPLPSSTWYRPTTASSSPIVGHLRLCFITASFSLIPLPATVSVSFPLSFFFSAVFLDFTETVICAPTDSLPFLRLNCHLSILGAILATKDSLSIGSPSFLFFEHLQSREPHGATPRHTSAL